jgi:hypothetical protein
MNRTSAHDLREARETMRTECGLLTVGNLDLTGLGPPGRLGPPVNRVTLAFFCDIYDCGMVRVNLSLQEARELAALLLAHATRAEQEANSDETPAWTVPSQ